MTPHIAFRGVRPTKGIEGEIHEQFEKVQRYCPSILACHVLFERRDRHHRLGNRYHVRVSVTVPDDEIVVNHEATRHLASQGLDVGRLTRDMEPHPERKRARVAIRNAFAVARRQLQDYVRRRRGGHAIRRRPRRASAK